MASPRVLLLTPITTSSPIIISIEDMIPGNGFVGRKPTDGKVALRKNSTLKSTYQLIYGMNAMMPIYANI